MGEMIMKTYQIEIVSLEAKYFIGVPVTNVFQRFDSERMKEANQLFLERRNEIKGIINDQKYVCPHFANDILFTYIYCMEVEGINDTPNGMIGFFVPSQRYIKVRSSDQDPYAISHEYLKENGLENNTRSLALEVFKFGEEQHCNNADIYIPIVEKNM
jgi:predicted transcriptional regulator YdeE